MSADVLKARAAVGVAARRGDAPGLMKARRDLAAANIAQYIQRVVSEAPPLQDAQVDAITMLLRPGGKSA
ncbi:hypothetical protein [Pseudarthrobacter oxydans]|uniref:hypothetical protein n=1 Tax=Pseudarthrobacter oxydans TaxID=1671 RepID=UPI002AA7AF2C|nr:hypothetical protein [Pseudarthrobacter oxydans]WPU08102.1 hypothetical protein SMD14_13105 [Pseudarthrobacter oxydans]